MQTRRFWKNMDEEITGEESVPLSGSSNHCSIFPCLWVPSTWVSYSFVLSPPPPSPCLPAAVIATRSTLPSGIYFKVLACLFILFRDFSVLCGEENSNGVIMKYYFTSLLIHNKQREMIGD